jgi:hypothetical protein
LLLRKNFNIVVEIRPSAPQIKQEARYKNPGEVLFILGSSHSFRAGDHA